MHTQATHPDLLPSPICNFMPDDGSIWPGAYSHQAVSTLPTTYGQDLHAVLVSQILDPNTRVQALSHHLLSFATELPSFVYLLRFDIGL